MSFADCMGHVPTIERMQVLRVTYGVDGDLYHIHEAFYTLDGERLTDSCALRQRFLTGACSNPDEVDT